jgi:hypothetical protein
MRIYSASSRAFENSRRWENRSRWIEYASDDDRSRYRPIFVAYSFGISVVIFSLGDILLLFGVVAWERRSHYYWGSTTDPITDEKAAAKSVLIVSQLPKDHALG